MKIKKNQRKVGGHIYALEVGRDPLSPHDFCWTIYRDGFYHAQAGSWLTAYEAGIAGATALSLIPRGK